MTNCFTELIILPHYIFLEFSLLRCDLTCFVADTESIDFTMQMGERAGGGMSRSMDGGRKGGREGEHQKERKKI